MTPDDVRTLDTAAPRQSTRLQIIDCDVHPAIGSTGDLKPFLAQRWRDHLDAYGPRQPIPFTGCHPYPKATPALSRLDAWPPGGGPPGSDLDFLRQQLLDRDRCQLRHPAHAVRDRHGPAQPGVRRRALPRRERVAGRDLDRARQAAERLDGSPRRGRRGGGRGDRALGRSSRFRPGRDDERTRSSRSAGAATGRSTKPPRRTACRSGCIHR